MSPKPADNTRAHASYADGGLLAWLRLPLTFDADELLREVENITSDWWIRHFNRDGYVGNWSIAPLRGPAGEVHPIRMAHSDPTAIDWADTPLLDLCPAIRRLISNLDCPVKSTRLMRLDSAAEILPHKDHKLGFEDGEVRLHVPIQTSPLVEFWITDQRVVMQPGEMWYLNVNLTHRVSNPSTTARIHLVIDCEVNDWMKTLFEAALAETSQRE